MNYCLRYYSGGMVRLKFGEFFDVGGSKSASVKLLLPFMSESLPFVC